MTEPRGGVIRRLVIDEVEVPRYEPVPRARYWEETERFNLIKDGEIVEVHIMNGPYPLSEWARTWLSPVQVCGTCGCLHRNYPRWICRSCEEARDRVCRERWLGKAGRVGVVLSDIGLATQQIGRALRDPVIVFYAEGAAYHFERTYLMPGSNMGGTEFSEIEISRQYLGDGPGREPIMKRNARNKGPRPRREWWRR